MRTGRLFKEKNESVCRRCPYYTHPFVPGYGNLNADIMVIARDPGAQEEDKGIPLVGQAGQLNDIALENVGIDRDDLYLTNVLKCRPPDNKAGTADWKQAEKCCRKYLDFEIKKIDPKIIVVMGNEAMRSQVKAPGGITHSRGRVFESDGRKIMPLFHPSYILRTGDSLVPLFVQDWARVENERIKLTDPVRYRKLLKAGVVTEGLGYTHTVVDTLEKFDEFYLKLKEQIEFTCDTETSALAWYKDGVEIICCGFCFEDTHAYVIPFRNYNVVDEVVLTPSGRKRTKKVAKITPFWKRREFRYVTKCLDRVFQDETIQKVMHNAKFDMHFLWKDNIRIGGTSFDDTMVEQHLEDENTPRDLKTLATMCAPHMAGYEREIKGEEEYSHSLVAVKPEILYKYCAGDCVATRFVSRAKKKTLMQQGLWEFYRGHSRKLLRLLFRAELKGAYIDPDKHRAVGEDISARLKKITYKMYQVAGCKFTPSKNAHLIKVLYERLRLPVLKETEKQHLPSTDKETLQQLAEGHNSEFAKLLLEWRELTKLYGTYVTGIDKYLDKFNTLHTTFRQARVATGRLSSSEPNLQNIPKVGPIKSMFRALPGYYIISADLSQAELRAFAVIADDETLLKDLAGGADYHEVVARKIHDLQDSEEVTPIQRRDAKTVNFSVLYGKEPSDEVRDYFDKFFEKYKKVGKAIRRIHKQALTKGYVQNCFGRRRRFNVREAEALGAGAIGHLKRQAANALPQSTASDVNNMAAIRIDEEFERRGMDAYVNILVHDNILGVVPASELVQAIKIFHTEMTRPVPELGDYSFPAEIGFGVSWEEAEKNQDKDIQNVLRRARVVSSNVYAASK